MHTPLSDYHDVRKAVGESLGQLCRTVAQSETSNDAVAPLDIRTRLACTC